MLAGIRAELGLRPTAELNPDVPSRVYDSLNEEFFDGQPEKYTANYRQWAPVHPRHRRDGMGRPAGAGLAASLSQRRRRAPRVSGPSSAIRFALLQPRIITPIKLGCRKPARSSLMLVFTTVNYLPGAAPVIRALSRLGLLVEAMPAQYFKPDAAEDRKVLCTLLPHATDIDKLAGDLARELARDPIAYALTRQVAILQTGDGLVVAFTDIIATPLHVRH